MRAVFESVGITDVLAKSKGSSNPHNLVKATFAALLEMRDAYTISQHRNITIEKVFNGNESVRYDKNKITQIRSRIGSTKRQKSTLMHLVLPR